MSRGRGSSFEYRVLGPVEVLYAGEPIAVTAPKERDLLALLLLAANRPVPAEELIDGLWGSSPPATARTTLQNYVKRLRRALAAAGDREVLATTPGGYLLRSDQAFLDLREFGQLTGAAAEAAERGDHAAASARLRAALALWRGDALAGCRAERLSLTEAPRLDESRAVAFENRIESDLRLGRHADVLGEIRAETARHPLRERLHGHLMTALYRSGHRSEALAAYQHARELLVRELGLEPGPELISLHARILADDPGLLAAAASPLAPAARTEPRERAAPAAALPAQLPPSVPVLVGRQESRRALDGMLARPGSTSPGAVGIVLLTGEGGVGKTALAVHWGHHRRDRFPDGQLFVDLRGHHEGRPLRPIDALGRFLHALAVATDRIPTQEAEAAALFRSLCAGRRLLIVLDNAHSADQVRPLLPGSAHCLVLVTSRDSLAGMVARDGAVPLRVPVLEAAEAAEQLTAIIGESRVTAEPEAARALVSACAHLPLAIAITAAHLALHPDRPLSEQLARLSTEGLTALEVPGDRRAAIRAVFDLSYVALSPGAARLFRLLGLVPGGDITLPAAAALAATTPASAAGHLDELTRSHLLEQRSHGRYTFHDLLRAYAAELSAEHDPEPDRAAALDRLSSWYLGGVDAAARLIHPNAIRIPLDASPDGLRFTDAATALDWLDTERENAVAVVRQCARTGPRRTAWLLSDALRPYMMRRSYAADWLAVASAGLAAAEAESDLPGQAAAHRSLSSAYLNLSDYRRSMRHDRLAVELYRRTGSAEGLSSAHNSLCLASWFAGDLEEALHHGEQAALQCRAAGFREGGAIVAGNLGAILHEMGRLSEAEAQLKRALRMYDEPHVRSDSPITERNLGAVLHDQGRREAATHLHRAADLQRGSGHQPDLAYTLFWLALHAMRSGDRTTALAHLDEGFELATGEARAESYLYVGRATLAQNVGNHGSALRHFDTAIELAKRCDARAPELRAHVGAAESHLRDGRLPEAAEFAEYARTLAATSGYRLIHGQALRIQAELDLAAGAHRSAADRAEHALTIQARAGHLTAQADTLVVLGHVRHRTGDTAGARLHWHAALSILESVGTSRTGHVRDLLAP
ncbi:BTAD domain-containing putative transcriptional regulator [Kitasatospora sp. NPDC127111]|uniref:AfsR/SARP family transcriptional regulator n=1 Tax=Kitasatospora sp. NPDC127111 TaxID=3345363 RepID=UPI00363714DF